MSFMGTQAFTGVSYDELVAQYSQAVAAASSAVFNQSTLARKVRCPRLKASCCSSLHQLRHSHTGCCCGVAMVS